MTFMPVNSLRAELVQGYRAVAAFHEASGNVTTAGLIAQHACDVARLEVPELLERAEVEGDLLCRCVVGAPFRGIA